MQPLVHDTRGRRDPVTAGQVGDLPDTHLAVEDPHRSGAGRDSSVELVGGRRARPKLVVGSSRCGHVQGAGRWW